MRPPFLSLLFISGVAWCRLSAPITSKFKCLSNGCCDEHEWCRFWASIGECAENPDWMSANCQLACDTCVFSSSDSASRSSSESTLSPIVSSSEELDGNRSHPVRKHEHHVDCASIRANPLNASDDLWKHHLVNPVENVSGRKLLSIDDITKAVKSGCVPVLSSADCRRSLCYHLSYRSFDGTCNNLDKPLLGAAFRPYKRLLPAEYDGGFSEPVSSIHVTRPTAREISRFMLSSRQVVVHDKFNSMLMQWGQFISHDTAKTTLQPSAQCKSCSVIRSRCMPIVISPKDNNFFFKKKHCLKVSRSAPVCGTGDHTPREQMNENTAFIDASPLYGSSTKDLHKFRDGRTGLLLMKKFNNQKVLPFDQSKCKSPKKCSAVFTAGDIRVNLFLGLSAMHIIFTREHNRIAAVLERLNPSWSGDRVFQETRKIVGAEVQAITYKEFLPKLLGNGMEKVIGAYKGYDPDVDPTIANVFTTSAYRVGHGMLMEFYRRIDSAGANITQGGFKFGDGVFKSSKLLFEGGIDPILRGFMMTAIKRPHRMTPSITEKMFGSTDLASLNIQRGRDHGLPSYNKWRKFCGLKFAQTFDDLKDEVLDPMIRNVLSKHYNTPDDIDLYIGSMLEDPLVGGLVGPTLSCLIGDQFKRLRDGDRFYYENPGIFTDRQLDELHKVRLSRVICDNGDNFDSLPEDAFLLPDKSMSSCNELPSIDLSKWKE